MYSGISEGKSFREQLSEERKEWWRVGKLRGAVIAYLCSKWYRNEGHRRVDLMADTIPEGLEIDAKDWPEAREFLLDIKDRDLSAFYPENSDKSDRRRTPVASNKSQRMEIPGKIKLDTEMKNLTREQKPGFVPVVTKPAILDEIDDLDLFVKRRLKYKGAEGKQDRRLTQTQSPDDISSTLRNQTKKNETGAISPGWEADEKRNMAANMAPQVDPRSVIHAGSTWKHACSEVYVDARKHQDTRTVNAGQLTGPKTELDWTQDGCQMDQCKPHTERSMPEKGHFEGVEPHAIPTPGNTDMMRHKYQQGEFVTCSGYQPSFAPTKSTVSRKADSQRTKKPCFVDTLTVARKMKEFLPPCKLTDGDKLLNKGEGGTIENNEKRIEDSQKTEQSCNLTDNKGREATEQRKTDSVGTNKLTGCNKKDREGPENLPPENLNREMEVGTEQIPPNRKSSTRGQEPVIRPPYRQPVTLVAQSSSAVNVNNRGYQLHRTFGCSQAVPGLNIVPGCRRRQRRDRPLSLRKIENCSELRETETKNVESPNPAPTPVKRDSFRGRCARYFRHQLERLTQAVTSLNCCSL